MNDVFAVTGITEGEKARLTRLAKRLRQIDVASLAIVNVCDITALEKNRYLSETRKRRILAVLGLLDDESESD